MQHAHLFRKQQSLAAWRRALERRHGALDRLIAAEHARPMPDQIWLQDLKRQRLRLKEEMTGIEGVLRTVERMPAACTP